MADVQFIGKTTEELATFVGRPRQVVINTDTGQMVVCDGQTPGGIPQAKATGFSGTVAVTSGTLTVVNGSIVSGLLT